MINNFVFCYCEEVFPVDQFVIIESESLLVPLMKFYSNEISAQRAFNRKKRNIHQVKTSPYSMKGRIDLFKITNNNSYLIDSIIY